MDPSRDELVKQLEDALSAQKRRSPLPARCPKPSTALTIASRCAPGRVAATEVTAERLLTCHRANSPFVASATRFIAFVIAHAAQRLTRAASYCLYFVEEVPRALRRPNQGYLPSCSGSTGLRGGLQLRLGRGLPARRTGKHCVVPVYGSGGAQLSCATSASAMRITADTRPNSPKQTANGSSRIRKVLALSKADPATGERWQPRW